MLEQEKWLASRDPAEEEQTWLAELETQRERLLDLYLGNKSEADRYGSRVAGIKRPRKTTRDELDRIRDGAAHLERLGAHLERLGAHLERLGATGTPC